MAAFLVFCIIGLYVFNKEATTEKLSDEVDWRAKGAVSLVLDEKTFDFCWAIAAAGAVESAICQTTGSLVRLSVQELIDCVGCDLDGG
ncbi:cathepsin L [Trifolium repens]|nr:cathepsin L [Trifolium repens]